MRLGQRFPLLGGQDGGEIIGMSDEEVVPACEEPEVSAAPAMPRSNT